MVEEGLRERKARQTWEAIHRAASDLAAQFGVAKVSVGEIARAANVSVRTVFNYFPTKENAVLGTRQIEVRPEVVDAFLSSSGPLFDNVAELMFTTVQECWGDFSQAAQVLTLVQNNPSLFEHLKKDIDRFEERVVDIVRQRTSNHIHAQVVVATVARLIGLTAERWIAIDIKQDQKQLFNQTIDALRNLLGVQPGGSVLTPHDVVVFADQPEATGASCQQCAAHG